MNRNTKTSDNTKLFQSNQNNDDFVFMVPNKESLDKSKDINILFKIRQSIIDFETGQSQIKHVLQIIGHLSSQITYNDKNDPNSRYIRNKYGFIRRNKDKNNRFNANGIYFESLSYLKNLLCNRSNYDCVLEDEINGLGPELIFLKQKIDLILSEQNSTNDNGESFDQSFIDISKLTEFATKYHEQIILEKIRVEVSEMKDIDFHKKEDRYYFGRIYCIIGELFNEWLQIQKNMEQTKVNSNIERTLKKFIKLRDRLVHHHERINSLTKSDNESIKKIIVDLKDHLGKIIVVNQYPTLLKIDHSYNSTEDFDKLLNELYSLMFGKSMKAKINTKKNEDKMSNDEKIMKILHGCIKKAIEIIVDTREQSNNDNKSINKQYQILQLIKKNYEKTLNNLSSEEKKNFPPTLDSDYIEEMISLKNQFEEMKSLRNQFVPNPSVSSLKPFDKLLDIFQKKMSVMMEEITCLLYFFELWNVKEIQTNKERYIIEYSMLVIGQLVRDIEDVQYCQYVNNQSNSADLTRLIPLNMIREAALRLKTLRNQGLAHNTWNFDSDSFSKNFNQIKSAISPFVNYYYFIKKDLMPENCESLYFIGFFLINSHKYVEAINYLEKCRTRLSNYPNEAEIGLFSYYKDKYFEKICQIKPILWYTLILLAKAYSEIGNSEKSKEIALYLLQQVDYDEDSDVDTSILDASTFQKFLEDLCCVCIILKDHLDPNVYIELLESFYNRYGDFIFIVTIGAFYKEQKNYEKAKEVFKYIFENSPNINNKILSVSGYEQVCLEHCPLDSTSEIKTVLDPMVACLTANNTNMSLEMLESYLSVKELHCLLRLDSIQENICLDGINESEKSELKKLSTQLQEILPKSQILDSVSDFIEEFIKISWIFVLDLSLDIGTGLVASLVPKVFKEKPKMTPIQNETMTTLINIITDLINKDRELKKRNPHPTNEGNGLSMKESGDCLCQYGKWFSTIFRHNHSNHRALSLSLPLFAYAIKCLNEFLKYCNELIDPPHDLITDAKYKIEYCYSSLSLLMCDLPSLKMNISKLKSLPTDLCTLEGVDMIILRETIEMLEDIRDQTISVLSQILEASNDDFKLNFHDEFVVRYLAEHFNIRINENNSGKSLIYEGTFDELQNKIRLHVNSNNLNVDETNENK